jgi:hypothetical protein
MLPSQPRDHASVLCGESTPFHLLASAELGVQQSCILEATELGSLVGKLYRTLNRQVFERHHVVLCSQ